MNETLVGTIRKIREDIGAISRDPEITRVRKAGNSLRIECEDRADKSIIIGTGGGVVGRLATSLHYDSITVESRLDTILQLRRQIHALDELRSMGHSPLHTFITNYLFKLKPPPIDVVVAGEEYIWACGLFEDEGSRPVLLHTGHVDKRVKEKYNTTQFIKIDPEYEGLRVDFLYEKAVEYCKKTQIPSAVGPFYCIMKKEDDVSVADIKKCLGLTNWEAQQHEKKRYHPHPYTCNEQDRAFMIKKILESIFEGVCEPNECAKAIIDHWTENVTFCDADLRTMPDFVKKYRQKNALRRARQLSVPIYDALSSIVERNDMPDTDMRALVSWSGGTDSSACISLSTSMGFDTDAATVAMPHIDKGILKKKADSLSCKIDLLDVPEGYEDIEKKVHEGKIHPCGQCHTLIDRRIVSHAREKGYDIVIFGDMLSSGAQSVVKEDDLFIINLPAALALTKIELHSIEKTSPTYSFGCPLLRCAHETCNNARKVSIQRVLREMRAQALNERYAYNLISDIMTTHTLAKQI